MSLMQRLFLIIFLSSPVVVLAQIDELKSVQQDSFYYPFVDIKLSRQFPVPSSISFLAKANNIFKEKNLSYSLQDNIITLDTMPKDSVLIVQYRYYDLALKEEIKLDYQTEYKEKEVYIGFIKPENPEDDSYLPRGLDYHGTFGRGLSAGNNQSLVLNSTFNLQLNGSIGDGIDVRAVISDANIPIQADGNTQQLQEFDQVFIELTRKNQTLVAGDYRLERPENHFINYSKRLKGLKYQQTDIALDSTTLNVHGSFAIAGGQFSRNILSVIEGNQGPYKLSGANNEQFIIAQSGSEKVYIDGILMVRGLNHDYTISYDRAEVSFTEKRPITKDSRVIVEFEYQVLNYARTIISSGALWETGKHQLGFEMYRESDNKNAPGTLDLSESDRLTLAEAGEDEEKYITSSIRQSTPDDEDLVLYRYVFDAALNDSILIYSDSTNIELVQANFSDLGAGNGRYSIDESVNINGRVYVYVGPGMGRYEPVRVLIPAVSKSMYSLSHDWAYHKDGGVRSSLALNNFDHNLFSKIDQADNLGVAGRIDWNQGLKIGKKEDFKINLGSFAELLSNNFDYLNPYRNAEFNRDWNLSQTYFAEPTSQRLIGGSMGFDFRQKNSLAYEISTLNIAQDYNGIRQSVKLNSANDVAIINGWYSTMKSESLTEKSFFQRPNLNIKKTVESWNNMSFGVDYQGETNELRDVASDTLKNISYSFDQIKIFTSTDETKKFRIGIDYTKRIDKNVDQDALKKSSIADNYSANLNWQGANQNLDLIVVYRSLVTNELSPETLEDANTLLGGLDYQFGLFDGKLKGTTNINFNSAQEPKLEFDYREVLKGEGDFVWIDDGDGIKEKNEFQIAVFADQGNYIRVSLFNNEYIQVYKQEFVQGIRWDPIKWRLSERKALKVLSKFSSINNFRLSRKDLQGNGIPSIFEISRSVQDTNLVSYISALNTNFYWNRGNPSYDVQFNYIQSLSGILLTTGNEQRSDRQYIVKVRKNINKKGDIDIEGSNRLSSLTNRLFTENNYIIETWTGKSGFELRFNSSFLSKISYSFVKKSHIDGLEKANSHELEFGVAYSKQNKTRIESSVSFNNIDYTAGQNETIEFIMLEGLKAGNNFLWEANLTQRLINNFDLILTYNGRKSGENKVIHQATAQVRATF